MRFLTALISVGLAVQCAAPLGWALGGAGADLLPDIPAGSTTVRLELVVDLGVPVTGITVDPVDPQRFYLVGSEGVIRILQDDALLPVPFLDTPVAALNREFLGLALHPSFPTDPRLYVIGGASLPNPETPHYVAPQDLDFTVFDSLLLEYQLDATNPDTVDLSTRRELLRIRQPHREHNLNHLLFGPDGYLYLAMGDGGTTRTGTPTPYQDNAQDLTNPFGAVLRIDIDTIGPNGRYGIPATNPLPAGPVPELFAWGLRNPWRLSRDRDGDAVYVASNGDFTIESLYRVEAGANYGWAHREGTFAWDPVTGDASVDPSPDPTWTDPIAQYDHNTDSELFASIIGGPVYRGTEIPGLFGQVMAFDWMAGVFLAIDPSTGSIERIGIDPAGDPMGPTSGITFGEGAGGELWIGGFGGEVWRVHPSGGVVTFRRADCNQDDSLSLADVVCVLAALFQGATTLCADASDVNDDGAIDVSDAVSLLAYLFQGGATPPEPFGACGPDPTGDALDCASSCP